MGRLTILAAMLAQLSIVAFGGGNTILPEMQRQVVEVHHWMTAQAFAQLFALAQAAPGPNLMIVVLIGWNVAGLSGALISAVAGFGPSSILTMLAVRGWERHKERRWRRIAQEALMPLTVGLITASAAIIGRTASGNIALALVFAASAVIVATTRINPLLVLGAGAVIGFSGLAG